MAIITVVKAEDAGGLARVEIDYDNATSPMRITNVRLVNNTDQNYFCSGELADGTRRREVVVGPQQTRVFAIPTGASQRWGVTVNAKGGIDGVVIGSSWPSDLPVTP